ncbi:hypothetical protein [Nitrosomonas halophila]|uniref:Uncharacterized protein n=1 Tax=Nitrosomonas halophila TaxID=44576 RepID=A0A1H3FD74_9PROT|nr:hypothetical protein [Nitrosomonas halophila]SDX89033.1 hypothetical protein SAMN05421881_101161 [Nitrosomonas halophila]
MNRMPESFYDLACRLDSLQAIAAYIPEAIPCGEDASQRRASRCAVGIAHAVMDLLAMCEQDLLKLEQALAAGIDSADDPA